jgi:hypothetical protein
MRAMFFLITAITFVLFFIEAMIHFNIGRYNINGVINGMENRKKKRSLQEQQPFSPIADGYAPLPTSSTNHTEFEMIHEFTPEQEKEFEKTHRFIRITDEILIHIPDNKELFYITITVLIFSTLSGLLSSYIIHHHLS